MIPAGRAALPSVGLVLRIHASEVVKTGGADGVRDAGGIEAAVARAEQLIAYRDPPPALVEIVVAIGASIIRRHPFVDGNKRVGFKVIVATLAANGLFLDVSETEAYVRTRDFAAGDLDEDAYRAWIAANLSPPEIETD